jgi:hypothetical protein
MAGMTKGAGMIHPNMAPAKTEFGPLHATLLGCIMTDLAITPRGLQSALTYAVDRSFDSISVDGDILRMIRFASWPMAPRHLTVWFSKKARKSTRSSRRS